MVGRDPAAFYPGERGASPSVDQGCGGRRAHGLSMTYLLRIRRPNGESFSGREFSLRENGEWLCFSPYILVQAGDTRYGMGRGGCTERRRDSGIAAQKMIDVTNMASVWYDTIGPDRTPR